MKLFKKLLPVMVSMVLPAVVQASGFQLIEQNTSGLGNAYAGQVAAAENASTIYYNPAGMTYLCGRQVSVAAHLIGPSAEFKDDGLSDPPGSFTGSNGGDAGNWTPTGNAYLSWQLTPCLWTGIGFAVPFGLKTDYSSDFVGRFQSKKAELKTYDINPSIAYRVCNGLSVGAGFSYQHAKVNLDRSFYTGSELPERVRLDDSTWGWNIGLMYEFCSTRVGLSYRSSMEYDLEGNVAITGVGAASAKASIELPDTISLGFMHELNCNWQLLGDFTYTRWSTIDNVPLVLTSAGLGNIPSGTTADTLDFQLRDSYRIGFGANYLYSECLMFKVGTAYDRTPVRSSTLRTVILPDSNRWWIGLGAKYQVSCAGTIDVGYAHLFIADGDIYRNKVAANQGIVSGQYESSVNIFSVSYTHSF